jgi:leucyl-tRNA synthetase
VRDFKYDFSEIEKKWIDRWETEKTNILKNENKKESFYMLEMFPYPSGEPHMGHARNYTIGDVLARVYARKGADVLHPIGYDSFGLPAENAAIKSKIHPKQSTQDNIRKMRTALKRIAMTYDFDAEIITSEPDYYKWTQWFFLLFYKMGLAQKKKAPVNWCSSCNTVLANEQVIAGRCERCDSEVIKKTLSQWFFKITDYAQRLLDDMELLEGWPERVLTIQRNWIGRSQGARIEFALVGEEKMTIPVFTTRPDTVFGATFFILSPDHPLVDEIVMDKGCAQEIAKARAVISGQTDIERGSAEVEKIGAFTGRYVLNPLSKEKIPIWIANYVLSEYGTGAIMAVPAHDERDFEFAKKYGIEIRQVISEDTGAQKELRQAYTGLGTMIHSGPFSGMGSEKGKHAVIEELEKKKAGNAEINYKLKDWLISRQRYWGAPIPIVYCQRCGTVPIREEDLPVVLPYDVDFRPTGLSPLATSEEFVQTKCPSCQGEAKRETDTMDTFVCSSWYFLRYCSPKEQNAPFEKESVQKWMPVDQYIGGIEHATMHLIYARFFTKVLYDAGLIGFKEPFTRYFPHGVVNLGGQKMSKSKGNIVNPSEIYNKYGADTLRLYILFMGPADSAVDWSDGGVEGASRFLNRFARLICQIIDMAKKDSFQASRSFDMAAMDEAAKDLYRKLHQTIKKVSEDILQRFNFNTAISAVMELTNSTYKYIEETQGKKNNALLAEVAQKALLLLSPIAPCITEELWHRMAKKDSIHRSSWPDHDAAAAKDAMRTIVFQVNGKVRDKMQFAAGASKEEVLQAAFDSERLKKFMAGKKVAKTIFVADKLLNIAVT